MSRAFLFCLAPVACLATTVIFAETPPDVPLLQRPELKRAELQRVELPDGKLVTIMTSLQAAANFEAPRHVHPGVEVGYVLEGAVEFKIGDAPPKTFNQGESFLIPANTPHSVKIGPNGVKLLNTFVVDKDKPLLTPMP
jgi:quercetin dioxygenase-like cupin family protein